MDKIKVNVMGVCGRMGRRILTLAVQSDDLEVTGAVECSSHPDTGKDAIALNGLQGPPVIITDNLSEVISNSDVIIDFTSPDSLTETLKTAKNNNKSLVIGSTGLMADHHSAIDEASKTIPIVQAANMSRGVNLLFKLAYETAGILKEGYDVEIIEMHHRHKKDAPSGTAVTLSEQVAKARNVDINRVRRTGREGNVGERPVDEIGVMAIRGGSIVGEHTVIFAGTGERVELTHRAGSRDTFAAGALTAVRFVHNKTSGRYNMQDVLGL